MVLFFQRREKNFTLMEQVLYWTFWNMYKQFLLPWSTVAELDLLLFWIVLFWANFAESSGWKSMSSPSPFSNSSSIKKIHKYFINSCHNLQRFYSEHIKDRTFNEQIKKWGIGKTRMVKLWWVHTGFHPEREYCFWFGM